MHNCIWFVLPSFVLPQSGSSSSVSVVRDSIHTTTCFWRQEGHPAKLIPCTGKVSLFMWECPSQWESTRRCKASLSWSVLFLSVFLHWNAPWKNQIYSTTTKLRKSLIKALTRQKTCNYNKLFGSSAWDRHARRIYRWTFSMDENHS